jgi:hypothetical protein
MSEVKKRKLLFVLVFCALAIAPVFPRARTVATRLPDGSERVHREWTFESLENTYDEMESAAWDELPIFYFAFDLVVCWSVARLVVSLVPKSVLR